MADDEFNFDFENSLEPPQNNKQVSFDLMLCCLYEVPRHSILAKFLVSIHKQPQSILTQS